MERKAKKRKLESVEESQVQPENFEELKAQLHSVKDQLELTQEELRIAHEKLKLANEEIKNMKNKLSAAKSESEKLKKEFLMTEESFKGNDGKVCFFTGLPSWDILQKLFKYVLPCLSSTSRSLLSPFQQLLLTLMRLRLNLSGADLGFRFNIHMSTVSRIFTQVIEILYYRLRPLIYWPDRDSLRKSMPMDFRKHCPNCAVIIDCFEIFLDKPSHLLTKAQSYSAYKHHQTVKYLIGITPQGTVCFLSEGWGGRVSDKHLTENCNLLSNLIPGDTILADRGFDIKETVGLYCATITMPAFTKGKKQLSGIEVEQSRQIANVRIHVERVIGLIRQKYQILQGTQPVEFVTPKDNSTLLDKVVSVSCGLINLCDSVVPFE